jgi:hypothetical protein
MKRNIAALIFIESKLEGSINGRNKGYRDQAKIHTWHSSNRGGSWRAALLSS